MYEIVRSSARRSHVVDPTTRPRRPGIPRSTQSTKKKPKVSKKPKVTKKSTATKKSPATRKSRVSKKPRVSKKLKAPKRPRISVADSPELNAASRRMATLALERLRQEGTLKVRQREQLRRALAAAAAALEWSLIPGAKTARVAVVTRDMATLADAGADLLERDLADQLEAKKAEMQQLKKMARSLHALAADKATAYPMEIEYSHTARNGSRGLFTKIENVTLNEAGDATSAAAAIEKRIDSYTKLRDEMLIDLKQKQRLVAEMRVELPEFVEWSNGLILDVMATLT